MGRKDKLSEAQIMRAKLDYAAGTPLSDIAMSLKRSEGYIYQLIRGTVGPPRDTIGLDTVWKDKRRLTFDVASDVLRMYHAGASQEEIVKELGLGSRKPIYTILEQHGLSFRDRNRADRDVAEPEIIRLFHEHKSLREMVEYFAQASHPLTSKQIIAVLKKHDLSMRDRNKIRHQSERESRSARYQESLLTLDEKINRLRMFIEHLDAGKPKTQFDGYSWLRKNKLLTRENAQVELARLASCSK